MSTRNKTKAVLTLAVVAMAVLAVPAQAAPIEPYRLVFITSTNGTGPDGTGPGSPEGWTIAEFNAHVQGLADAAGIGIGSGVGDGNTDWFCIGSTADVDARDNTGTNPNVSVGVAIYNLVNDSLVAIDNADLWDGTAVNTINYDETGALKSHWPFTGTGPDGTQATANYGPLGQVGGNVAQGQSGVAGNWIHRTWTGDPPGTALPLYAMSEIIPEPATMSLLALGGLALLRRRRNRA